jgi:prepilin-type N-terminal cleavage/methylation domain-containing protein
MKKGFSLIELTVALTLAALFLSGGTFLLSQTYRTWKKISTEIEHLTSKQFILNQMVYDIKSADQIQDLTRDVLTLKSGHSTINYDLKAGKIRRRKDGGSAYLNETGEVKILSFAQPQPGLVLIRLDEAQTGAYRRNEK